MGKRQLGELQPFEFAITLVASELACIPMADATIPIIYGILPVFTLFVLHLFITKLAVKSIKFRKVLNGKPAIVMNKGNIDCSMLKKLDMNYNDLTEALRGAGYFTPANVECAVVETNGSLSVLPKFANSPVTNADMNVTGGTADLPCSIIVEGKFMGENLEVYEGGVSKQQIEELLDEQGLTQKDVFLLSVSGGTVFMQPYGKPSLVRSIEEHPENAKEVAQ